MYTCSWYSWFGFPGSSVGEEYTCNAGDPGSIPGLERYSGEGIGYSFQYSWASWWLFFGKKSPCSAGDLGSILGLARSPGGGLGKSPHGYSTWGCKESDMTEQLGTQHILWHVPEICSFLVLRSIHLCRYYNVPIYSSLDRLWFLVIIMNTSLPRWHSGKELPTNAGDMGSSILVWKIPWTEEPGGLQSMTWQSRTQLSN